MRTLTLPLCLIALSGCSSGLRLDETGIFIAHQGAHMPFNMAIVASFATLGGADGCPAVTEVSETEVTLTGGCTDDNSQTWTGSATLVEQTDGSGTYTYTDFGSTGSSQTIAMDGTQTFAASGELTSDVTASWNPGSGEAILFTYDNYALSDFQGYVNGALGQEATDVTLSGTLDVDVQTTYTVSASWSNAGTCEDEWDSGQMTLVGAPEGNIVFTWSADSCDGCADYRYGDQTGTVCD